jgi:uncharacterized cupredoxin-like copper-binding protein
LRQRMMPQWPFSRTAGSFAGNKARKRVFIGPSPRRLTHDKCVCQSARHATPEGWMTMHTLALTPDAIRSLKPLAVVTAAALLAASAAAAAAPVTVQVSLTDRGMEAMAMVLSTEQAKAGSVTFQVSNKSESLVHEFIVVKTDAALGALPYNQEENEVKEDSLNALGEVEDLNPDASGTLTLDMAPGQYVLLCNKAGHFKAGMAHSFTVIP